MNYGLKVPADPGHHARPPSSPVGTAIYVFYALQPYLLQLCGATRRRTASPGWSRRWSPARRSSVAWSPHSFAGLFARRTSALLFLQ